MEKIEHKLSLRVVQNGHIIMKDCRVPEANRLQGDMSFRDTARVLRMTRSGVAWMATGVQMGAYEHALRLLPAPPPVRKAHRHVQAVLKGLDSPLVDGLALESALNAVCMASEDRKEGAAAFVEKRAPQFQGR